MTGGWVAGSVRAKAMTRRRLGSAAVRELATSASLEKAVATLARSSYGHDVRPGQTLAAAQRAVVDAVLWNLRVLAGWQPQSGVATLRLLVAAVEAANVCDRLELMFGGEAREPYRLGALATVWPRLSRAGTPDELRRALVASPWGDPGGATVREVGLTMRADIADHLLSAVPAAAAWAAGDTALLLAREVVLQQHDLPQRARTAAGRVLGSAAVRAGTLVELRSSLPNIARWVLDDVSDPGDLWRAEARWWSRVERDGRAMLRAPRPAADVLVGAVAVLAADGWRVRGALEVAARGHQAEWVLDEVE